MKKTKTVEENVLTVVSLTGEISIKNLQTATNTKERTLRCIINKMVRENKIYRNKDYVRSIHINKGEYKK